MLGKSTRIDYDLLKQAVARAVGSGGGYKPIPKGSYVAVVIPTGTAVGQEFNATVEPDEGYLLDISYLRLEVPPDVEANVLVTTDEGETPLLADNTSSSVLLDASDFGGLGGISKVTLYVKVLQSPSEDVMAKLEYGGRQVRSHDEL